MCVSILLARGLVAVVETAGVGRADFLAACGIDPARLDDAEDRLASAEYDRLLELALDLTGDDALGLKIAETADGPTYNLVAYLVAHSRTLRDGMQSLMRFNRLLTDRPVYWMEESEGTAILGCNEYPGSERCYRLRTEMSVFGLYRMFKYFTKRAQPERVSFVHAAPSYRAVCTRAFDGLERFEQRFNGVVLASGWLDVPQPNHDAQVYAALEKEAARRLARLSAATYTERLRQHVMAHPRADERSMVTAARALGLSVRSLRRRLREEGACFQQVVDGALHVLSRQLLSDPQRSIKEVAITFGYVEQASFCRAFKRWSGLSPSEYRAQAALLDNRAPDA